MNPRFINPPNQINREEDVEQLKESTTEEEEEAKWFHLKFPSRYVQKNHPEIQILGNKEVEVETKRKLICTPSQA